MKREQMTQNSPMWCAGVTLGNSVWGVGKVCDNQCDLLTEASGSDYFAVVKMCNVCPPSI